MSEETYNGWPNRETWAVKLHWDNNQRDQEYFYEEAKKAKQRGDSVAVFAEFLIGIAEEIFDNVIDGANTTSEAKLFVKDVGSLWRVDWFAIAEEYYNEVDENERQ